MSRLQPEALQAIRDLGGTSNLLEQIVRLYFDTTPSLIANLKTALAASDLDGIRSAAHSLKSGSANLGARDLAQMCAKLEAAARTGSMGADAPDAGAIEREYQQVSAALLAELDKTSLD
jgi:HPt (histidine-containing phosphotransfer) domain-containing protein